MRTVVSRDRLLWTTQILLALFFAGASGAPKLLLPADQLPMPLPLSQGFLWFIGTCEVLGALGLILPGLTRVQPRLTILAAACLTVLTICAAVYQVMGGQPANALFALVIGALAATVAYGRTRIQLPARRTISPAPAIAM
ncbi:MAG: DoxX family protein [Chloroflexi bacterium]|nr:DoxX family protein [Chloroflexota bacterium]